MLARNARRGFTLIEVAAVLASVGLIGASGVLSLGARQPERQSTTSALSAARRAARIQKDLTQLRGINQGMIVWAQNNKDVYPLPSKIDVNNFAVKEEGAAKDTTANIYSMMIYNGTVSTEIYVSPLEKNPDVKAMDDYAFDGPKKAVNPEKATWDPAFAVGLGPEKGNASYAHLQPSMKRLDRWSNTFSASEIVLSSRGPIISAVDKDAEGRMVPTFANPNSRTIKLYDDNDTWTGHVVANDNHVDLNKSSIGHLKPFSGRTTYKDAEGKKHPDLMFWDEPADTQGINNIMGMFTKAGAKNTDFKAIGD